MTTVRKGIPTPSLLDMIDKRHPAPGWVVVREVGNSTGYQVSRHADAIALGIWPSHGHALHGFELKRSRSDVQKELSDPRKADAIGKYCDYWWLVVSDLRIIDGIVIPETWGILCPGRNVLRVQRKAPKLEPRPFDRGFASAIIRKVLEDYVPKHTHEELKKVSAEKARAEIERERKYEREGAAHDLEQLRRSIERFESYSGVSITQKFGGEPMVLNDWELSKIGAAVKVVREARDLLPRGADDDPVELVRRELGGVERAILGHEQALGSRRATAEQLRAMIERLSGERATAIAELELPDD